MIDLVKAIERIEWMAEERELIADHAVDPNARASSAELAKRYWATAREMRKSARLHSGEVAIAAIDEGQSDGR